MTKEELVHITLKQLCESLKTTPENFRFEDGLNPTAHGAFPGPTIVWQFKVQTDTATYIPDPLNATKTIIVTYNKMANQLNCYIYNREVNNLSFNVTPETTATVQYSTHVPNCFYRTFRQFQNLNQSLIRRRNEKEYLDYLKKLAAIFPQTHDDELLK